MEHSSLVYLIIGTTFFASALADECVPHHVANGNVTQISDENHPTTVWRVQCHNGFTMVGTDRIKCRKGIMTAKFPVCTSIGGCNIEDMPEIDNGRKVIEAGTRGSVFKYTCYSPFKLFGHHGPIGCRGGNKWNLKNIPVCTRLGCDESTMKTLTNGESRRMLRGRVYKFKCEEGSVMEGSPDVYCNGNRWNGTKPECLIPPQNVRVSGPQKIKPGHGQKVKFSCKSDVGNPAAELTYKVFEMTSGPFQNDILHQLVTDGVVELQESKERFVNRQQDMTENNNSGGNTGWVTSREILIHPRIVRKVRGNQLRIQCLSNENIADELVVELIRKPTSAVVIGPDKLRYNERGTFQCTAHPQYINPKPQFSWRVQMGAKTENIMGKDDSVDDDETNQFATSTLEITPETAIRDYKKNAHNDLVVECLVSHAELGVNFVSYTHLVEVLYPPGRPEIHGLNEGSIVKEGRNQQLLCKTKAGKPPAHLVWYMGEHMVDSQYRVNGDSVEAKITFVPRIEDDGMEIRCEAHNDAVADPFVNTLILGVDRATTTVLEMTSTTELYKDDTEEKLLYDTDTTAYYYQDENAVYPDYGDNDYVSKWTENNSIESNHPEETNELTTRHQPVIDETPTQSEDDLHTNFVHKNDRSVQAVEINDDPDVETRSSLQQRQHPVRSGRKQDTSESSSDELPSIAHPSTGSSERLRNDCIITIAVSILILNLRFH